MLGLTLLCKTVQMSLIKRSVVHIPATHVAVTGTLGGRLNTL